jgi:hypothetical protein
MGASTHAASSWAAIYDGQHCIGHVINRGKSGWETFDTDDQSIGLFKTPAEAANVLEGKR